MQLTRTLCLSQQDRQVPTQHGRSHGENPQQVSHEAKTALPQVRNRGGLPGHLLLLVA